MNRQNLAALGFAALLAAAPAFADPATDALAQRLDQLAREVTELQKQVTQLKTQNEALANQLDAQPAAPAAPASASAPPTDASAPPAAVVATLPGLLGRASLFGYGELSYNRYTHDSSATQADLRRAVFGIGYRFDDSTRFVSEFEFEHAVASSADQGEAEVEQFYIDHRFSKAVSMKAGLILIPSGYLNETHEPPRFYGVERNFVETAIIPSTWREGGIALYGSLLDGLRWDVGVTTGQNLNNWDFTSDEGRESPLGAIHQELQLAGAADLAQYVALNYDGVRALNVGASVFTGAVAQQSDISGRPRVTLWEAHTRWTPGRADLSALYARGTISNTAALNLANVGQPTPIPAAFYGWYLQGAYRVWQDGGQSLAPFVRYERYNTASGYAGQPLGLGSDTLPTEAVVSAGANYYLNPNVVFKADYQRFSQNTDMDRFDLGLGFMFY